MILARKDYSIDRRVSSYPAVVVHFLFGRRPPSTFFYIKKQRFLRVTRSDRGPDEREGRHEVLVRDERAEVVGGVGVVKDVYVYNTRKLSRIQSNPSG